MEINLFYSYYSYILSEGNLKNLACFYSDIGWRYDVNNGGVYLFSLGYLTSCWAGS
ncbi:hypothetical protein [Methanobrevibacter sp. V14]|uniref:hypothetical protein n=1 Tax=Methanobrevibacter sp. V14 TaxID=3064280 RepID=UPI002736E6A8|nr:hypothetical protein [Methanobrevibacter sp. V14]